LLVLAALIAGGLGIALVSGYSASVSESYGALKPVVVVTRTIPAGELIAPRLIARRTEVRQVPLRFVPAGALSMPAQAFGFESRATLPAGSYLTRGALKPPGRDRPRGPRIGRGRVPVELTVSGAGALDGGGRRVDVLVTTEGRIGGRGETRVAAEGVPLIAVAGPDPEAATDLTKVVLGLTRRQAITLIDAEAFARRVTVLPRRP
jgi:Flp pilus assembly protein CpaB